VSVTGVVLCGTTDRAEQSLVSMPKCNSKKLMTLYEQ
jgi:hypothetical protein